LGAKPHGAIYGFGAYQLAQTSGYTTGVRKGKRKKTAAVPPYGDRAAGLVRPKRALVPGSDDSEASPMAAAAGQVMGLTAGGGSAGAGLGMDSSVTNDEDEEEAGVLGGGAGMQGGYGTGAPGSTAAGAGMQGPGVYVHPFAQLGVDAAGRRLGPRTGMCVCDMLSHEHT